MTQRGVCFHYQNSNISLISSSVIGPILSVWMLYIEHDGPRFTFNIAKCSVYYILFEQKYSWCGSSVRLFFYLWVSPTLCWLKWYHTTNSLQVWRILHCPKWKQRISWGLVAGQDSNSFSGSVDKFFHRVIYSSPFKIYIFSTNQIWSFNYHLWSLNMYCSRICNNLLTENRINQWFSKLRLSKCPTNEIKVSCVESTKVNAIIYIKRLFYQPRIWLRNLMIHFRFQVDHSCKEIIFS